MNGSCVIVVVVNRKKFFWGVFFFSLYRGLIITYYLMILYESVL